MIEGLYEQAAARIRDLCPSVIQVETGMAAEAAADMLALGPDVTALVTPLSDTADPVRDASFFVSQRVRELFGVTLALTYPGGFAQFEPARREILRTLCGWAPDEAAMPVAYAGGRILQYSAGQAGGRWLHLLQFAVPSQLTYEHKS